MNDDTPFAPAISGKPLETRLGRARWPFADDNGNPHETGINRLARYGIVNGVAERRYAPSDPVTRAQMATFLVRFYEFTATDRNTRPAVGQDRFDDDNGNSHEGNINQAGAYEFVAGKGDGYAPSDLVTRAQMASFLMRVVERMYEVDHAFYAPIWWYEANQ